MKGLVFIRIVFVSAIFAGLIVACEGVDEGVKNEGEVVLSSERILTDTYRSVGFSFKEGKNVPYPAIGGIIPDIIVTNETDIE